MAELSTTDTATTTSACCAPEQQATCCEPSAKADCCDPSHGEGCGCDAGNRPDVPAGDIREQVRERYAAAAVQVTTTDPGRHAMLNGSDPKRVKGVLHAMIDGIRVDARDQIEPTLPRASGSH